MKTAELRMIPVSELKPAEYNPRKKLKPGDKEYEKIKNSIEEFGFADPLVVNADMSNVFSSIFCGFSGLLYPPKDGNM